MNSKYIYKIIVLALFCSIIFKLLDSNLTIEVQANSPVNKAEVDACANWTWSSSVVVHSDGTMHAYWNSYASDESGHYIWDPASPSYCYVLVDNTYYFKVSDMFDNYKNGAMGFNVDSAGHVWDDAQSRGGWHYNDTSGTHDFKVLAPISLTKQPHNWTTTTEPSGTAIKPAA